MVLQPPAQLQAASSFWRGLSGAWLFSHVQRTFCTPSSPHLAVNVSVLADRLHYGFDERLMAPDPHKQPARGYRADQQATEQLLFDTGASARARRILLERCGPLLMAALAWCACADSKSTLCRASLRLPIDGGTRSGASCGTRDGTGVEPARTWRADERDGAPEELLRERCHVGRAVRELTE